MDCRGFLEKKRRRGGRDRDRRGGGADRRWVDFESKSRQIRRRTGRGRHNELGEGCRWCCLVNLSGSGVLSIDESCRRWKEEERLRLLVLEKKRKDECVEEN